MYGEKYEEYANYTDIRDRIGTVILRIKHKEVITKNSVTNKLLAYLTLLCDTFSPQYP